MLGRYRAAVCGPDPLDPLDLLDPLDPLDPLDCVDCVDCLDAGLEKLALEQHPFTFAVRAPPLVLPVLNSEKLALEQHSFTFEETTEGGRPKAAPLCCGSRSPPPSSWL